MANKIRWINTNPGAPRDESGYWRSIEGRFEISPNYRHTVYPDSYTVEDSLRKTKYNADRIKDCKWWAEDIIARELTGF